MSFYERIRVFTWVILKVVVTFLMVFYGSFVRVANGAVCLPEYGHWNSVFKRYDRWVTAGIWDEMFAAVHVDADL